MGHKAEAYASYEMKRKQFLKYIVEQPTPAPIFCRMGEAAHVSINLLAQPPQTCCAAKPCNYTPNSTLLILGYMEYK
jgi:hypothetical protein